jgi:type VI secretion system secreted protein Hcp
MKFQRLSIAMIAAAAGISSSASAYAAVDMFLRIDGISGESQSKDHKGESDVLALAWGAASTPNGKKGCVQDVNITKYVDSASPQLITNAATAAPVAKAVLSMRKSGEGQRDFLTITMTNVKVSSYQAAASSGGASLVENLSLTFDTMEGDYKPQDDKGGLGGSIPWSIGPNPGKCS